MPEVTLVQTNSRRRISPIILSIVLVLSSLYSIHAAAGKQLTFASPDQAFSALFAAAEAESMPALLKLFGPEGQPLVSSGDPVADRQTLAKFVSLYAEQNRIMFQGTNHATLRMGKNEWPFPIPLVMSGGAWHFDTMAGKEEILDRRIGLNELSAIEVCHAYVDAQREYASKDRNHDGFDEYAQKFASSPGKRDGLYWPTRTDEEESPLGPLVAAAQAAGYKAGSSRGGPIPYYGYYYRILYGQGKDAPGGAYDYVVNGHMIGGFALVAFPAQYDVSGITTFIVNHDGLVYQKDLGPHTAEIATQMTLINPDATWAEQ